MCGPGWRSIRWYSSPFNRRAASAVMQGCDGGSACSTSVGMARTLPVRGFGAGEFVRFSTTGPLVFSRGPGLASALTLQTLRALLDPTEHLALHDECRGLHRQQAGARDARRKANPIAADHPPPPAV